MMEPWHFPTKLLSQDEVVVRHMHTHIKVILPQIIGEILLVLAAAIGSFYVPEDSRYWRCRPSGSWFWF